MSRLLRDLKPLVDEIRPLLPEGSRVIEHGPVIDSHKVSIISEFSPELMAPGMEKPVVWTSASFTVGDEDWLRRGFHRLAEKHNAEWAFIHSPEYAAALAKTR